MTQHLALFLLIIFSVHLLIFLRLTFKHKRSQFLLATMTFTALALSNALHLWRPGLDLAGHDPHAWLRFMAWCATAGSVVLFIRDKVKLRKA
jgi:asparagine N-glycosylation enzyme membrane subunit Stt3